MVRFTDARAVRQTLKFDPVNDSCQQPPVRGPELVVRTRHDLKGPRLSGLPELETTGREAFAYQQAHLCAVFFDTLLIHKWGADISHVVTDK